MNIPFRLLGVIAGAVAIGALTSHGFWELSVSGKDAPASAALLELCVAATLAVWLWCWRRHAPRDPPEALSSLVTVPPQQSLPEQNLTFQKLVDALPEAVTYFNAEDRLIYCNRRARQLFQRDGDAALAAIPRAALTALGPPRRGSSTREPAAEVSGKRTPRRQQADLIREHQLADGRWLHVHERGDEDGGALGVWTDITAIKQREENAWSQARILESMVDAVVIVDQAFQILECNRAASALLGREANELEGSPFRLLLHPEQAEFLLEAIAAGVRRDGHWQDELCLYSASGENITIEAVFAPMTDTDAQRSRPLLVVMRDIRARKAADAYLGYVANYDPLTALPNRMLFRERLDQVLAAAKWRGQQAALHIIDLDNFKLINEGLGHVQGDEALRGIAQRLGAAVHRGDTLARIGGNKFALIQTALHQTEQSALRAQRVLEAIEPTLTLVGGRELNVSASIGIALYPQNGTSSEDLTHNAGLALSRAKAEGRNTYRFFVRGMEEEMRVRCALEHDLGRALAHQEFLFHYQPQIELATGRVIGCEALIRWRHPKYGLLYPNRFIPMAEESGAIVQIGEWGLREVCRQLKTWQREQLPIGRIAVNLSAVQFRYPEFASIVAQVLQEAAIDPGCLELEITESLAMEDPALAASIVAQLKDLGVKLAIDDFGAGYSALNYLKRFPVQMLKIDRSLVDELTTSRCDAAITLAVIELGHSLNMQVLAEGIETREQLEYLRRHRCDFGQGASFATAMPAGEFAAYVNRSA